MPPPSGLDPWMAGRHFGVVIDAGSSGSRLQIYSWKDPRSIKLVEGSELAHSLPKVEKGTEKGEDWVTKVVPGISSFAKNPEGVAEYLRPLLSHSRKHIPPSLEKETPLFLLATAGMRLLTPVQQASILEQACLFLSLHSTFKIDAPSDIGPCGSSVRIITGEEEGLFGWIAVNYLMDGFVGQNRRTTYGFLDMGGASTQIAFEPGDGVSERDAKNLIDVRLRLLGGQEIKHKVFVTTWLGYGTNQARERYVGKAIREFEASRTEDNRLEKNVVPDPCLPKGLELTEKPTPLDGHGHASKAHRLRGTGSFVQCMQTTAPLLNTTAPCPDSPCLMNGIHVPPIDFSVSHFIGVSEYWYSSEHVFGLGGPYDFVQYERAAAKFCSRSWEGIMKEHEVMKAKHRLGGDGEVEIDGEVVEVGNWHPSVERSRLEMQCFKAAWIANVLHEGIGIPRLTDPGGNVTTAEGGEKVEEEAEKKGLGRPAFQSLDTVGDIAISWTLGKMVLEASKEVPALSSTARPLVDPIDEAPDTPDFHIQRIRPLWTLDGLEDRLNPLLPAKLTRTSLGFSPVLFLLLISCLFFTLVAYPLRRQLRGLCLRSIRQITRRDDSYYSLEEGSSMLSKTPTSSSSRPSSPTSTAHKWLYPIRRVFSFTGTKPQSPTALSVVTSSTNSNSKFRHLNGNGTTAHNGIGNGARISPTRSYSLPNDFQVEATASATQYSSRSPSPSPASFMDDSHFGIGTPSLARSRNTSQMNLSASFTRQGIISRTGSFTGPGKGAMQDE
ncbi:putative GDA1 CD39 NTPase family protein [Lyophyllum shimeji]|uniref:GDA1 CD39 NTPase family protein n=1 Tax=Lyophyllum shimeji TaxID=47721 RepID=A0A9P3PFJ6_LYOSH|nr:putative GDA1 CD39 NTPase family protein [Lyophyllum shimeji]